MCVNPYYGFQLAQDRGAYRSTPIPITAGMPCSELIYENPTQGGQISGRSWIWNAILTADEKFHHFTRYWPVPTQVCDEYNFQRPYSDGLIRLRDAKIKALGQETFTLIDTLTIVDANFLDLNNDSLYDTVRLTYTIPASVTDLDEITVFLAADDREYVDSFCRAQVRPVKVKRIDATTVRLDLPIFSLVRPILYRGYAVDPIDPALITNFVSQVEIYRKWIDPSKAITIMRRTDTDCLCDSSSEECYDCENVDACIVNAEDGLIRVDMRGDGSSCYCRKCAHRMCIHYVAGDCGYPELIARLAAAELRGDICCGTSPEVRYWQADYIGVDARGKVTTSLLVSEQGNQFGTKRGQVEAYRYLRERRKFKAVRI